MIYDTYTTTYYKECSPVIITQMFKILAKNEKDSARLWCVTLTPQNCS